MTLQRKEQIICVHSVLFTKTNVLPASAEFSYFSVALGLIKPDVTLTDSFRNVTGIE